MRFTVRVAIVSHVQDIHCENGNFPTQRAVGILTDETSHISLLQFDEQQQNLKHMAKDTEELQIQVTDLVDVPGLVLIAYLFNPYTIFNCVAQTTTVWSNVFLAGYFYFLSRKQLLPCCLCLALEAQRNFYPIVLIVPAALYLSQVEIERTDGADSDERTTFSWKRIARVSLAFLGTLGVTHSAAYAIANDWTFLDATYGFM